MPAAVTSAGLKQIVWRYAFDCGEPPDLVERDRLGHGMSPEGSPRFARPTPEGVVGWLGWC